MDTSCFCLAAMPLPLAFGYDVVLLNWGTSSLGQKIQLGPEMQSLQDEVLFCKLILWEKQKTLSRNGKAY
jgi:hypothetical protein